MQLTEKKRIARIALDAVGEDHDFVEAGSMALKAHGMTDREPDDIDLFQPPGGDPLVVARVKISEALKKEGYHVFTDGIRKEHIMLDVRKLDNPDDAVRVDLAIAPMEFSPVDPQGDGLRVMAKEDLVCLKAKALAARGTTKDYIDWDKINATLGVSVIDSHLATSRHRINLDALCKKVENAEEVDDAAFAAFGVIDDQLGTLRKSLDSLADTSSYPLTKHVHDTVASINHYKREALSNPQSPGLFDLQTRANEAERNLMQHVAEFASARGTVADSTARRPMSSKQKTWQQITSKISGILRTPSPPNNTNMNTAQAANLRSTLNIEPNLPTQAQTRQQPGGSLSPAAQQAVPAQPQNQSGCVPNR